MTANRHSQTVRPFAPPFCDTGRYGIPQQDSGEESRKFSEENLLLTSATDQLETETA
jgi:hypothetical protein